MSAIETGTQSQATTQTPAVNARTTWALDASHTNIGFAVKHLMISTVRGNFTDATATVTLQGTDYASARIEAEIEAGSITTRNDQRDAHLRSADFFDAENFPKLTFRSTSVTVKSDDLVSVSGDLTIRGTTKPVTLLVSIDGVGSDPWGGKRIGFSTEAKIKRSEFGLTWNQVLETGGFAVGDEIKISIEGELVEQK